MNTLVATFLLLLPAFAFSQIRVPEGFENLSEFNLGRLGIANGDYFCIAPGSFAINNLEIDPPDLNETGEDPKPQLFVGVDKQQRRVVSLYFKYWYVFDLWHLKYNLKHEQAISYFDNANGTFPLKSVGELEHDGTGKFWLSDQLAGTIIHFKYDKETHSFVLLSENSGYGCIEGLAYSNLPGEGERIFACDRKTGKLMAINPSNGSIIKQVTNEAFQGVHSLCNSWNPYTNRDGETWLYGINENLIKINPSTLEIEKSAQILNRSFGIEWAYSVETGPQGDIYISDPAKNKVFCFNPALNFSWKTKSGSPADEVPGDLPILVRPYSVKSFYSNIAIGESVKGTRGIRGFYVNERRPLVPHVRVTNNCDGTYDAHFSYAMPNATYAYVEHGDANKIVYQGKTNEEPYAPIKEFERTGEIIKLRFDGSDMVWTLEGSSVTARGADATNTCGDVPVVPTVDRVSANVGNFDADYKAYFGYNNPNDFTVDIPKNTNGNNLVPYSVKNIEEFYPGIHTYQFSEYFNKDDNLIWYLNGLWTSPNYDVITVEGIMAKDLDISATSRLIIDDFISSPGNAEFTSGNDIHIKPETRLGAGCEIRIRINEN